MRWFLLDIEGLCPKDAQQFPASIQLHKLGNSQSRLAIVGVNNCDAYVESHVVTICYLASVQTSLVKSIQRVFIFLKRTQVCECRSHERTSRHNIVDSSKMRWVLLDIEELCHKDDQQFSASLQLHKLGSSQSRRALVRVDNCDAYDESHVVTITI